MSKLTPDEVAARITDVRSQINALAGQLTVGLDELAGIETLLGQASIVRKPELLLRGVEENLRALVQQLNAAMHVTLLPLTDTEEQVVEEEDDQEEDDERQDAEEASEEADAAAKISVQPQGARFITLIGETHRLIDVPRTFAAAAAQLYEQHGGLDAPIRIPSGQRKFTYVPLRFILARGGGFMFWKNIQAARKTLGELYKTYGKNQIRKSHPVSPGARKMHNRTRSRGLERIDEVLARWEASLEVDASKFRIEVMVEMVTRLLVAVFSEPAETPTTRDDAFAAAYDDWQKLPLIIVRRAGANEGEDVATTFLRSLEQDINGKQSHFVEYLGWVITQLEVLRQGGRPSVNEYVERQLKLAFAAMRAEDPGRWMKAIDVLWRQFKILDAEVARKVTRFDKD